MWSCISPFPNDSCIRAMCEASVDSALQHCLGILLAEQAMLLTFISMKLVEQAHLICMTCSLLTQKLMKQVKRKNVICICVQILCSHYCAQCLHCFCISHVVSLPCRWLNAIFFLVHNKLKCSKEVNCSDERSSSQAQSSYSQSKSGNCTQRQQQ